MAYQAINFFVCILIGALFAGGLLISSGALFFIWLYAHEEVRHYFEHKEFVEELKQREQERQEYIKNHSEKGN